MAKKNDVLLELVKQYDRLRTEHTQLGKDKDEVNSQIKTLLGDAEQANVPGYRVTYRFDKDKTTEVFDEEKFKTKNPVAHRKWLALVAATQLITKKYTKTVTTKGARKLLVEATEA